MADLTVTAANVSANQNQGATIRNYKAGGTVNVGDAVYVNASNQVLQADADVLVANARAVGIVVNTQDLYGSTSAASGQFVSVCVAGPVDGFASLTPGLFGWVSKTAGKLADAAPTGGAWQYTMGHALDTVTFMVDPGESAPVSV